MVDQPRPVWLDNPAISDIKTMLASRNIAAALRPEERATLKAIVRAHDAAPANPVDVVTKELSRTFAGPTADSVLRALGMP